MTADWQRLVLEREEYVCAVCGQPGADLVVPDLTAANPHDFASLRAAHSGYCRRPDPPTTPTTSRDW